MGAEERFDVNVIIEAIKQVASQSEDGKLSLSELTSVLSRFSNREEARKYRNIVGRDVFGFKVLKKAG